MSSAELHEIRTECEVLGEKVYPSSLTICQAVDSYTTATITHYTGPQASQTSIKATNEQVLQAMSKAQNYMYNQRSSADVSITLKVDGKDVAKFEGYTRDTTYSMSTAGIAQRTECVDSLAYINGADYSIYGSKIIQNEQREKPIDFIYGDGPEKYGWKIEKCIDEILKDMVGKGPKAWTMKKGEQLRVLGDQHQINTRSYNEFIKPLLGRSKFFWEKAMQKAKKDCNHLNEDVYFTILNTLMQSGGDFLNTLLRVGNDFNCMLLPGPPMEMDKYRFRNRKFTLESDGGNLEVPVSSISASAGNGNEVLPILHCAVVCKVGQGNPMAEGGRDNLIWVVYPDDGPARCHKVGGTILQATAPSWYKALPYKHKEPSSGANHKEGKNGSPSEGMARQVVEKFAKAADEGYEAAVENENLLHSWAKFMYRYHALEPAAVVISSPMLKGYEVGKRYKVKDHKGVQLFEGFLQAATYTVVSEGSPSATVDLRFTHCEYPGFTLPGKND